VSKSNWDKKLNQTEAQNRESLTDY